MICIYNAGSFLNEEEMPTIARREIFRAVAENRYIHAVIIESRPEFITKEAIAEIEEILAGKRVDIGVGLELENGLFREICINKGFSFEEYESCAKRISESSINLLSYILVKSLFLTITESIEIMRGVHHLPLEIRIGGFEFFPIPEVFIQNCAFCNKKLYDAIVQYNATKKGFTKCLN